MDTSIIALANISRSFVSGLGEKRTILQGLNLDIKQGSFNVIKGESGSGKTTLLRILGMLDCNFKGEYKLGKHTINGKPDWFLDELRSENIGFIFQEGRLFDHIQLKKNISLPLQLHSSNFSQSSANKKVDQLANQFFTDKAKKNKILSMMPTAASGGEKQRISIMRAIINRPSIILADEPTASLNGDLKNDVVDYLHQLCNDGHTVIVVSHDTVFFDKGRQLLLIDGSLEEENEY